MNHHYKDIRERIADPPSWWDEHAVPRYCAFSPRETADIYAQEVVLLRIECQGCGRPFDVCMSSGPFEGKTALAEAVEQGTIHYGDPPNVGCCAAGATMNSIPRRVLEFWRQRSSSDVDRYGWELVEALERDVTPDWAE